MSRADNISVPKMLAFILVAIVAFGFYIAGQLSGIAGRLETRFPTEKEEDYRWSQDDPMGHWEAHKDDKKD